MSQEAVRAVLHKHPASGNKRILAVVLADCASPDGQHIALTVAEMAARCRIHERGVQRHLRALMASGWLVHVGSGTGGRGRARRYRINPVWLADAAVNSALAPSCEATV